MRIVKQSDLEMSKRTPQENSAIIQNYTCPECGGELEFIGGRTNGHWASVGYACLVCDSLYILHHDGGNRTTLQATIYEKEKVPME